MENKDVMLEVEVVYASSSHYKIIKTDVPVGSTIEQAIQLSGILGYFPEITSENEVGLFGQIKEKSDVLKENTRVEIYRPLHQDPLHARKSRVVKKIKRRNWGKDRAKFGRPSHPQNKSPDDGA